MKAHRLVAILLLLQRHGKRTASQLAEHLEVSERTILRDITSLGMAGVPVYADQGPHGGFRLAEGYRVDLTGMRSPELRTLFLRGMDEVLADLGWDRDAGSARTKLFSAMPKDQQPAIDEVAQRFYIDETRWFVSKSSTPFLRSLQDAIWANVRIRLAYQKPGEEASMRIVMPYALVSKAGVWYLVAEGDSGMRVYRTNRVADVEILDDHFQRPESFNLEHFWRTWTRKFESSLPTYQVLLWVEADAYETFVQKTSFPIEPDPSHAPDGYGAVRVTFETMDIAANHVLSYNFKVFVVEPPELRTLVVERARQILSFAP